jgi:putative transposase
MTFHGSVLPSRWIHPWVVGESWPCWKGWQKQGGYRTITIDNGPEFAGRILDEWAYRKGIKLNFIRPGKPIENAYAESFNGRFRDECLNTNWFISLRHAKSVIEEWRRDYNEVRPHSSLKGATPKEYALMTAGL